MRFKPAVWYPIAAVAAVLNVGAVWFAAVAAEPAHATLHAAASAGFALWAAWLRPRRYPPEPTALPESVEPLALEVDDLRRALAETQERLDFAERVLMQSRDPRRREEGD